METGLIDIQAARALSATVDPATCCVALLSGGSSAERPISLASGDGALEALREAGFTVDRFDPASEADMAALQEGAAAGKYDVAFLTLHGKGGEDGTIQAKLEAMGLRYTGSGVSASKTAIDKNKSKEAYKRAELRTAPWVHMYKATVTRASELGVFDKMLENTVELVGQKTVVKAIDQGSSQGLFIAETPAQMADCITKALEFDNSVVVERFVEGTEFTVAVVGNDDPRALPVIQIVPAAEFYDFDAKYTPGGSQHLCPAPIAPVMTEALMANAIEAHKVLGCRGMSRTDFIVDQQGLPWILETNTIPGMTKTSLLPDAARVAGLSFPELCTYLIALALQ